MINPKIGFLFPGQGSQFIGMGKEWYNTFTDAKEIFQYFDHLLEKDLSKLMFSGELDELTKTTNAQPAILAVSIAIWAVINKNFDLDLIIKENKKHNFMAAGHSLGEYSALYAGGALTLEQTIKLVYARAQAMEKAIKERDGSMIALIGAEVTDVEKLIVHARKFGECQIANDNGANQIVISCDSKIAQIILDIANEFNIKKAIKLHVGGAFHSTFMESAKKEFEASLCNIDFSELKFPVFSNYTASLYEDIQNQAKHLLSLQITGTVRWREIIETILQHCNPLIEIGPKNILSNIVKKMSCREVEIISIQEPKDLDIFAKIF